MKQYNNIFGVSSSNNDVVCLVVENLIKFVCDWYHRIEQKKPILKIYRFQYRTMYKCCDWMEQHPILSNVVTYTLVVVVTLQMFVGFMDAWCGL